MRLSVDFRQAGAFLADALAKDALTEFDFAFRRRNISATAMPMAAAIVPRRMSTGRCCHVSAMEDNPIVRIAISGQRQLGRSRTTHHAATTGPMPCPQGVMLVGASSIQVSLMLQVQVPSGSGGTWKHGRRDEPPRDDEEERTNQGVLAGAKPRGIADGGGQEPREQQHPEVGHDEGRPKGTHAGMGTTNGLAGW